MMPTNASRDDWALLLARLANALRQDWDVPGIRSAIHNSRNLGSREDVAIALVELTKRDDLKTPALLAQDGPHWHTGRTPNVRILRTRCTAYGHEYERIPCRLCPTEQYEPTDAPTLTITPAQAALNAQGAALVRQALRPTTSTPDARTRAAGDDHEGDER